MKTARRVALWLGISGMLAFLAAAPGCGAASATTAPVKGKVTANGQPVTGGMITLTPSGATKATLATGEIGADGSFQMTTEKLNDGAAIGAHTISYNPPAVEQTPWDGTGTAPPPKFSPYDMLVPKATDFEVKAGQNELNIELVPRPQAGGFGPGR